MNKALAAIIQRLPLQLEDRGLLGQGGMGRVLRVYDPRFGREAALKILLQSQDPQQVMRFVREVRISARLDHPGIPPVYDSGRLPQGQHYMLMKLVQGETLKQRLEDYHQQGRPPRLFRDFIETLLRVCEAVSYAHDQGLVHRDLKPENIMIGSFFEVLVMDWGLARDVGESEAQDQQFKASVTGLTEDGEVLGTPAYMSPEQARGESLDQQTDVFALGVILGNILTDQPLVSLNSSFQTIYAMSEGRYQSPLEVDPSVAKDWSELVERAMAFDPEQRTASVTDFADQLKTLLTREASPASRSRFAWWPRALAGAAVVAVIASFAFVRQQHQQTDQLHKQQQTQLQEFQSQWQTLERQRENDRRALLERLQQKSERLRGLLQKREQVLVAERAELEQDSAPVRQQWESYQAFRKTLAEAKRLRYLRAPDQRPWRIRNVFIDPSLSHAHYKTAHETIDRRLRRGLDQCRTDISLRDIMRFYSQIYYRKRASLFLKQLFKLRPGNSETAHEWFLYSLTPNDSDLAFLNDWLENNAQEGDQSLCLEILKRVQRFFKLKGGKVSAEQAKASLADFKRLASRHVSPETKIWKPLIDNAINAGIVDVAAVSEICVEAPENPALLSLCGTIFLNTGQIFNARIAFQAAIHAHPRNPFGYFGLGRVEEAIQAGRGIYYFFRALEHCQPGQYPIFATTTKMAIGNSFMSLREDQRAIKVFTEILASEQSSSLSQAQALAFREQCYRRTEQWSLSLADAKALRTLTKSSARSQSQYIHSLIGNKRIAEAIELLKDLVPKDYPPELVLIYCGSLFERDQIDQAQRVVDEALKRYPAHLGLLTCQLRLLSAKDPKAALEQCRLRLKDQPKSQNLLKTEINCLLGLGDTSSLSKAYKLFRRSPRDPELLLLLARSHAQQRNFVHAKIWAERACDIEPELWSDRKLQSDLQLWRNAHKEQLQREPKKHDQRDSNTQNPR